jgi:hypothetical protein
MVALAPRLTEAFSVPHVRIDAVCLTAQSLIPALGEPLRLIHDGRLRPERIDVRILLPLTATFSWVTAKRYNPDTSTGSCREVVCR